jgi:hypothetical protein
VPYFFFFFKYALALASVHEPTHQMQTFCERNKNHGTVPSSGGGGKTELFARSET